jgi:hypothetical protein
LLELEPEPASFGSPPDGVPAELHAATMSHKTNHATFFMASPLRGEPPEPPMLDLPTIGVNA